MKMGEMKNVKKENRKKGKEKIFKFMPAFH